MPAVDLAGKLALAGPRPGTLQLLPLLRLGARGRGLKSQSRLLWCCRRRNAREESIYPWIVGDRGLSRRLTLRSSASYSRSTDMSANPLRRPRGRGRIGRSRNLLTFRMGWEQPRPWAPGTRGSWRRPRFRRRAWYFLESKWLWKQGVVPSSIEECFERDEKTVRLQARLVSSGLS